MKKGRNPYVKGKDGKVVPTEQHHSQQKGSRIGRRRKR
jgi:hypothetical protein